MDYDFRERLAGLSDEEFERRYGAFARLSPGDVAALLDGLDAPWWIAGGWAIEAFTGQSRPHGDIDVCVLERDVPALFDHLGGSHHLWMAGGGMLCPLLSRTQPRPKWAGQIWVREDAAHAWLVDVIVSPHDNGRWVFRRDPTVVVDLERVTWRHTDGIVYQRPEITLAFKAHSSQPKDTADLEASLPKMDTPSRQWLAATVARLHPGHAWLDRIEG